MRVGEMTVESVFTARSLWRNVKLVPKQSLSEMMKTPAPESEATTRRTALLLLLVMFLSAILRLPLWGGFTGSDGLLLIWEAKRFLLGDLTLLYAHPLDLLSMTPYSPYPVGSVLLTAAALLLSGMDFQLATFTYSLLILPWLVFFSYRLNVLLLRDELAAAAGAFMYANYPILLQYSYLTMTARLPVLAIIPLFLEQLVVHAQTHRSRPLLCATLLAVVSNFFHRMAFVLFAFVVAAVLSPYVLHWGRTATARFHKIAIAPFRRLRRWLTLGRLETVVLTLVVAGGVFFSYILSLMFYFGPILSISFTTHSPLADYLFAFVSAYWTDWGVIALAMPFLPLAVHSRRVEVDGDWHGIGLFIVITLPALPMLANFIYARFLFAANFFVFGLLGIEYLLGVSRRRRSLSVILLGAATIGYYWFYDRFVTPLDELLLLAYGLGLVFIAIGLTEFLLSGQRVLPRLRTLLGRREIWLTLLCLALAFNSVVFVDAETFLTPPDAGGVTRYMTAEEMEVANYLASHAPNMSVTISAYSWLLDARLGASTGLIYLTDDHGIALVVVGLVDKSDVYRQMVLKPVTEWHGARIFYGGSDPKTVYRNLMNMSYTNSTAQSLIRELRLKFFVTRMGLNISSVSESDFAPSLFIRTLRENCSPVFVTENYEVWELLP